MKCLYGSVEKQLPSHDARLRQRNEVDKLWQMRAALAPNHQSISVSQESSPVANLPRHDSRTLQRINREKLMQMRCSSVKC